MLYLLVTLAVALTGTSSYGATGGTVQVQQHMVYEAALESSRDYENALWDVSVRVMFTSPSGKRSTVDAFWDGGRTWRVRFSPDEIGSWRWATICSDEKNTGLHRQRGELQSVRYRGRNPLYRHGPVRVSENGRHFMHADGTPFLWMACTAWNGVLRANPADWDRYLKNRNDKGFTAIQVISTHHRGFDKDAYGEIAYTGNERINVNHGFFQRLDGKFAAINEHGLLAVPAMLWVAGSFSPGNVLSEDDAVRLARYIMARWGAHQVVWILAGDGGFSGDRANRWKRIGREVFGDRRDRLVTMHPGSLGWVADEFRRERWFDFVGYQSGHGDSTGHVRWLTFGPPTQEWKNEPPRPITNLEPNYEEITTYHTRTLVEPYRIRRAMYWSLLIAPTAGVTYGHNGIWPWGDVRERAINHSSISPPWHESLESEGAEAVTHIMDLFQGFNWWNLRPAREMVNREQDPDKPEEFVAAARTEDGDIAVVYLPKGGEISLLTDSLKRPATARWYNPRTGEWRDAGRVTEASNTFTAPDENDWVLQIRAIAR